MAAAIETEALLDLIHPTSGSARIDRRDLGA